MFADVPDRTCDQRAEPPVHAYVARQGDVRLGRVVFLAIHAGNRGLAARGDGDPGMKVPVLVRTGPPVVVRLRLRGRTIAWMEYGGADPDRYRRSRAVRFHPCPPDTPAFSGPGVVGDWTAFPGGFRVRAKGCAVAESGTLRRRIALGVPAARCTSSPR